MTPELPADVLRRRRARILYLWMPLLTVAACLVGWRLSVELSSVQRPARAEVAHPDRTPAAASRSAHVLRVAIAPVVSPRASLPQYHALVDYLGRSVGRRGVAVLRNTYAEVEALLQTRQVDIAFVCTYSFTRGERDYGLQLVAVPVIGGRADYHSLLIVPAASEAQTLLDLQGDRFASADNLSNTGWLYPAHRLREAGHEPDRFFSQVLFTGGHDRAVHAVAGGLVDGAAVDSVVFDQVVAAEPAIRDQVRVLHRSPAFGMPPVVAPPDIDPLLRESLGRALLTVHRHEDGRAALAPLEIDRFAVADSAGYDFVRTMMAAHEPRPQ